MDMSPPEAVHSTLQGAFVGPNKPKGVRICLTSLDDARVNRHNEQQKPSHGI